MFFRAVHVIKSFVIAPIVSVSEFTLHRVLSALCHGTVHSVCVRAACTARACNVHNACVQCTQCVRGVCTMRACSVHNACLQCAQCVRAVCTVGACVQHGMCTGQTVHTIKSRGVIGCSLDELPASSNNSSLRSSNTAATCTVAPLPTLEEYRQFAGQTTLL